MTSGAMTIAELRESILAVVDYNWEDEERDFKESFFNDNSPEGHIFLTLRKLAAFCGRTVELIPVNSRAELPYEADEDVLTLFWETHQLGPRLLAEMKAMGEPGGGPVLS